MKINFFGAFENYLKDIEADVDNDLRSKLNVILHAIKIKIGIEKRRKRIRFIRAFSAAAAACLLISLGTQILYSPKPEEQFKPDIAHAIFEKNNTKSVKNIVLKDSTVLELWPAASLQYSSEYNRLERNIIHSSGKINYKVAKGKLPFVVKTGQIQTIAVGTEFTINKHDSTSITIQLWEGRVRVKKPNFKNGFDEFQMVQGETLEIKSNPLKRPELSSSLPIKPMETVQLKKLSNDIHFKGESLWVVLRCLENEYDITINVNKVLVDSLSFTGNFKQGTKIEDVIRNICLLNDLNYSRNGNVFGIKKLTK